MTRREVGLASVAAIVFALAFSQPLLGRLAEPSFHDDWDFTEQLDWVAYASVTRFHHFPLWNPYKCGGMPLLGNPQSRFLTPLFVVHLLFGPVIGTHLEVLLHLAIAWAGGYFLACLLGLGWVGALACASIFPAASWLPLRVAVGQLVFLPTLYLPWIVLLIWLAIERRRPWFGAMAGLVAAVMLGEGGVYPILLALVFVTSIALTLAVARRSWWPVAVLLVFAGFAAGFAAVKLLPAVELMRAHPRPAGQSEVNSLGSLLDMLLSRNQDLDRTAPGGWQFHEYGAYVGAVAVLLAVLGIASSPRRILPWLVSAGVLVILAAGDLGPAAPWTILHVVPGFSSSRVPSRLLIPLTFAIGVMAGFGADVVARTRPPLGRLVAVALVAACIVDAWLVGVPNLRQVFGGEERLQAVAPEFRQMSAKASVFHMLGYARANMGAVTCYEAGAFPTVVKGADEASYRGEQYLLGAGSVSLLEWSPNRLGYEVDAAEPTVLVVNQNYDRGWRVVEGRGEVTSHGGLLAVRLPGGRGRIRLAYRSRAFLLGLAITAATCVVAFVVRRR
jgi:hypothetical protein